MAIIRLQSLLAEEAGARELDVEATTLGEALRGLSVAGLVLDEHGALRPLVNVFVDGDQAFLGPHVLTSALKGVDAAVFLTIKAVRNGTFAGGGNATFGLDQDGVGLGKVSPKADAADVDTVEKVERQIAAGEISGIPTAVK